MTINIYNINISNTFPEPANWIIQIDAATGKVIEKQNKVKSLSNFVGRGIGYNGSYRPIGVIEDLNTYYLEDHSQTTKFITYSANHTTTTTSDVTDSDQYFKETKQRPAVDAAYFTRKVYDYYKNVHGRESYDGKGSPIYSIVNYDSNYNNAAWNWQSYDIW